ncbi:hypothetical protein SAMN05421827_11135 [Pedobacter terrae]|uniref:Uncharacterized protein n=1 Tax=Pedobacter terrae TaxID=405671 RepID=A0A1G7X2I7_9SPHI|nr:hypothetical protein [Pedobacter terrae]SDG78372.1 hypothetical protein SAMN05421827_11135 [Pedobacter terrae]
MESNENKNIDPNEGINNNEEGIEWDNGEATYGHKRADFKRKDEPAASQVVSSENDPARGVNENLTNSNLSQGEDIGNRNKNDEKGLRGKDL